MKTTFIPWFALTISVYNFPGGESTTIGGRLRIYRGEYTDIANVPYLAQILYHGSLLCGASIISRHWLITAAHCIKDRGDGLSIMTGTKYPERGGEIHTIDEIVVHALYDPGECENDIAAIRVKIPIKFGNMQRPIKLISRAPRIGEVATVSGFGKEGKSGILSSTVKSAEIPVVSPSDCKNAYWSKIITDKVLCMGWMHEGQPDTCEGDSGGPAVIDGQLAGIVSAGRMCDTSQAPGIYTLVFEFRDWIKSQTGVILDAIA
ncbi:hypothetical protein QAD02_003821 [Eretmocerus hayati]|uniref:Uncharacterized protein n=1 Tax=Eretmocerus hayati TaxID=131215 RepID=A0ACC2NN89_9HYME|nr:hypothetical protein QAD02_003821 [Eretmocerus hayati]